MLFDVPLSGYSDIINFDCEQPRMHKMVSLFDSI